MLRAALPGKGWGIRHTPLPRCDLRAWRGTNHSDPAERNPEGHAMSRAGTLEDVGPTPCAKSRRSSNEPLLGSRKGRDRSCRLRPAGHGGVRLESLLRHGLDVSAGSPLGAGAPSAWLRLPSRGQVSTGEVEQEKSRLAVCVATPRLGPSIRRAGFRSAVAGRGLAASVARWRADGRAVLGSATGCWRLA